MLTAGTAIIITATLAAASLGALAMARAADDPTAAPGTLTPARKAEVLGSVLRKFQSGEKKAWFCKLRDSLRLRGSGLIKGP